MRFEAREREVRAQNHRRTLNRETHTGQIPELGGFTQECGFDPGLYIPGPGGSPTIIMAPPEHRGRDIAIAALLLRLVQHP